MGSLFFDIIRIRFFMENKRFFTYTVIAACLICAIAVAFNIFTDLELPSRIMAAILGVVITATITQVLLQGQTKKEGTLKRSSKIFEEKLKIYQNFLNSLYKAVKDGKLTDSEKMELQFQTSLVAMHCKPENIITVSEAVRRVVSSTCPSERSGSVGETDLLKSLFSVVEAFRQDLYEKDTETFANGTKDKTIENFSKAFCEAQGGEEEVAKTQKLTVDLNVLSGSISTPSTVTPQCVPAASNNVQNKIDDIESLDMTNWEKALSEWKEQGWIVTGLSTDKEDWLQIVPTDKTNPAEISMGFYDNHYYIQAKYDNDSDFSKALKWDNGGRRSYGCWWEYLPEPFFNIPSGSLYDTFVHNKSLQDHIIERIKYLLGIVEMHHRTTLWKNALGEQNKWHIWVWYWKYLACEWQTEKEGKVYVDIFPKEDEENKVVFKLSNRNKDMDLLKQTLTRIEYQDRIKDIQEDDCCIYINTASFDANEIASKARDLIQRISG